MGNTVNIEVGSSEAKTKLPELLRAEALENNRGQIPIKSPDAAQALQRTGCKAQVPDVLSVRVRIGSVRQMLLNT